MADQKISEMTAASAYTGANEFYEIVQGGETRQGSHALLKTYFDTLYASAMPYAKYSYTVAANTSGGTSTGSAWTTRPINTENHDDGAIGSLSSNQITLAAGTYRIHAFGEMYAPDFGKHRIRDVTNGTTLVIGASAYAANANGGSTNPICAGQFTLAGTAAIELQYYVTAGVATIGLGRPTNATESEVYAVIEIWKVA